MYQDPQELKAHKPPQPGKDPTRRPKSIIHQNHKNVKPLKKDRKGVKTMKEYRIDIINAEVHNKYFFETEKEAMKFLLNTQIKKGQKAFLLKYHHTDDINGIDYYDVAADLTDIC